MTVAIIFGTAFLFPNIEKTWAAEPVGSDSSTIKINIDWKDSNALQQSIKLHLAYVSSYDPIDPRNSNLTLINGDNTADSMLSPQFKDLIASYYSSYKTIDIPYNETEISLEVPCDSTKENIWMVYLDNIDNYYCSVPFSNDQVNIDAKKKGIVAIRSNKTLTEKTIVLAPKTKKQITITNHISGGTRQYSEFFLSPAYYINDMKNQFNVSIIQPRTELIDMANDNVDAKRLDLYELDETDELMTKEWFVEHLRYFYQLTVPDHTYPNRLEKILESNFLQIEKTNWAQGVAVFDAKFKDIESDVVINKVDINNRILSGAEFELYSENGTKISAFNDISNLSLLPGKYILKEIKAPDGYEKGSDISFEISKTRNPNMDAVNKNTNNFFLADEKDIDELNEYLGWWAQSLANAPLSSAQWDNDNTVNEISKKLLDIEEAGLTKNSMRLATIIAANLLYVGGEGETISDGFNGASEQQIKNSIFNQYKEILEQQGMEEIIPYFDNSETLFPIIKLKNGESIVINDPVFDEEDHAIYLYAKNYNDEGYEINNRSIMLNRMFTDSVENYDVNYTYTGKIKDTTFQGIKVSSGQANVSESVLNVVNQLEETYISEPVAEPIEEQIKPVSEEPTTPQAVSTISADDSDVASILQTQQPENEERGYLAQTDGELKIYYFLYIIGVMAAAFVLRKKIRMLD